MRKQKAPEDHQLGAKGTEENHDRLKKRQKNLCSEINAEKEDQDRKKEPIKDLNQDQMCQGTKRSTE